MGSQDNRFRRKWQDYSGAQAANAEHSFYEVFKKLFEDTEYEIEKHPNADKLVVCKVDIGEITQIVTAATNIKVGDKVPVSLPGANLANGIHIEKSKLRGVESIGMFCSIEELGVTDYDGEANGIMILDDDAVVGEPIAKALLMEHTGWWMGW